jgi:hypothetical protein
VELVQDARRTIEAGAGDCDDKVTLLASLLALAGFGSRFVIGGATPDEPQHVWLEVYLDWRGEWLALDPTNEQAQPGWFQRFPYNYSYEIWPDEEDNNLCLTLTLGIIAAVLLTMRA